MLTVEDEAFWDGLAPVVFGQLPRLQDQVTVIGCDLPALFSCDTPQTQPRTLLSVALAALQSSDSEMILEGPLRGPGGWVSSHAEAARGVTVLHCRFPIGGESISVTSGVVSRIEVTSYVHGAAELLGVQIDAAINSGNSGGPAFNNRGQCVGIAFQSLKVPMR